MHGGLGSAVPPSAARFRGALLGGALGDALGFPYEGRALDYTRERPLTFLHDGVGVISDDTQQTLLVGECLLENGWLDPVDLSERLVQWVPWGVGKGHGTVEALKRHADGLPWYEAGLGSAGNGAAMRVAPIGLLRWRDPALRRTEAALSALPTHHDPMAAASAVIMADAVAALVTMAPERFDQEVAGCFAETLSQTADAWDSRRMAERRDRLSLVSLGERLREVLDYLGRPPAEAVGQRFWSGAFVLETLPTALWCFLRHAADPAAVLRDALLVGHDTDTVASLAGTLAGALNGVESLPADLLQHLQQRDRLAQLADGLWARTAAAPGYDGD